MIFKDMFNTKVGMAIVGNQATTHVWRPQRSMRHDTGGFSLLEVLVVLIIISLIVSLSVPHLSSLSGIAFHNLRAGLASDLNSIREDAVRRKISTSLSLDQTGYTLIPAGIHRSLPSDVRLALEPEPSLVDDEQTGIRFFPDGSSNGGSVSLSQSGTHTKIIVRQLDGQIETK